VTVLTEADILTRIWPLPARRLNGIGPKANARLETLCIRTIGELARADPMLLIEHFGRSYGAWMHEAAHGRDDRAVVTHSEPKSISRETTFENDLHPVRDRERLSRIFTDLCVQVAEDLRRKGYVGKTIGLKLRYDNFKTVTRDRTLEAPTRDAAAIRRAAGECLKRVPLDRRIRLLGVRMGALSRSGPETARDASPGAANMGTLFE
jgi:DNA polymerase-4